MKNVPAAHILLLLGVTAVFAWSGWQPYDRFTWWLEIFPGLVGLVILAATYRRFRLTTFCYTLIAFHVCILCVGGHYTYARVPLFDWLRSVFGWHRNHFDRLGHFAQGLVPAIIARELFVRLRILNRPRWMPFLILCVCLAISAFYELIEWWTALLSGSAATAFLATQGDVWDTQEDMMLALIGASSALIFLRRWHDRQLKKVGATDPRRGRFQPVRLTGRRVGPSGPEANRL
jgi:putative membrane protein